LQKPLVFFIYLFPLAFVILPKAGFLPLLILLLSISLITSFSRENFLFNKDEKEIIYALSGYFIVQLLYALYFDTDLRDIDTPSRFILVIPVFIALRQSLYDFEKFKLLINLSAISGGLFAIYQIFFISYLSQAQGFVETGTFGLVMSIFASFSLIQMLRNDRTKYKLFYLFGFLLGSIAMIYSGIRSIWVVALITNTLVFLFIYKISVKKFFLTSIVYLLILFISFPSMRAELTYLIENTIEYVKGEKYDTSVGHRGELYKAAFKIIKVNPLGIGEDNFHSYKKVLIDNNEISPVISHHLNAHSEVLSSAVEQGILGLISYLLVLIIPGSYFFRKIKQKNNSDAAILGLIIVLHYFLFSLTSVIFAHQSTVLFFTFMIVIIYAFIENKKRGN